MLSRVVSSPGNLLICSRSLDYSLSPFTQNFLPGRKRAHNHGQYRMNFGKRSRTKFLKRSGMHKNTMSMLWARDASGCQRGKRWRGYSMCCERAVNGRHCHGSTAAAARYTERFKNGWQQDFLRKSEPKVWKSMMKRKGSAGRGKACMAAG